MKMLRLAVAAVVVAACSLLALAVPASAYPNAMCSITDPGRACAGSALTLNASVSGLPAGATCDPISITWNGITRTGTGSSLSASFPTSLSDIGTSSSTASCSYTDSQEGAKTVQTSGSVIISDPGSDGDCSTVDDNNQGNSDSDSDSDNGGLPNTGGERLLWLIIGLILVAGGTAVVIRSRRPEDGNAN